MAEKVASLYAEISADTSRFSSALTGAQRRLGIFSGALSGIGRLGALVFGGLVIKKTVDEIRDAVNVSTEFQSQLNILTIAARASGTSMGELREAAIQVGADTQLVGIDAMEAADAMTNFYKAGLDTAAIFGGAGGLNQYLEEGTNLAGALRSSIDLAAASDIDLATASDAVAVAMATFQLNAEEAANIADIFVGAADASVTEVGELTQAFVNIGPTAASFGFSLEDTATALALLSERGIRGAEAGTALKSMLTNMMRPTDAVRESWRALNLTLYDADGHMRALPDLVADLSDGLQIGAEHARIWGEMGTDSGDRWLAVTNTIRDVERELARY